MRLPYTQLTNTPKNLQNVVSRFQSKLREMSESGDFESDPVDTWAIEAMRWVIGCRNLKYSLISINILNALFP